MKNKSVTYLLIAGVVAIWGIIFLQVFNSVSSDDEKKLFKVNKTALAKKQVTKERFVLSGNYRDPFLGSAAIVYERKNTGVKREPVPPKPVAPPTDWSFVTYNGRVYNKDTKKFISLVNIRGQSYMMKEKEVMEEVTLLKNLGDSILVAFGKEKKIIHLPLGNDATTVQKNLKQ